MFLQQRRVCVRAQSLGSSSRALVKTVGETVAVVVVDFHLMSDGW